MEPTLKAGESVLVSSIPYLFASPYVGDIVACKIHDKKILIKRIIKIKNKEYLVAGDNQHDSFDSRSFGKIDRKSIIGKVVLY
jgi:phage repressor protein C with HTH and peptisase S24 domain